MTNFLRAICLTICGLPLLGFAGPIHWRSNAPAHYQVKPQDNLWQVAAKYLRDPWQWSQLTLYPSDGSPAQAANARLFPGDQLHLLKVNGKPRLQIRHGSGIIRLSPKVRIKQATQAIPTISLTSIRPFLNESMAIDKKSYQTAPYVLAMANHHVTAGAGNKIYIKNLTIDAPSQRYRIFHLGDPYKRPKAKKILAYQADYIATIECGTAKAVTPCQVLQSSKEVLIGDRVYPANTQSFNDNFMPKAPKIKIKGQIISVLGGIRLVGRYNSVVIDQGKIAGVETGDVLAIYRKGGMAKDPVKSHSREKLVKLPDTLAGELLIYRVFDKVSYGLVMKANMPLSVPDRVANPE